MSESFKVDGDHLHNRKKGQTEMPRTDGYEGIYP
jgi:hypothetical protein